MNRRQRKKRRIGEFQELGFELRVRLAPPLSSEATDRYTDAVLDILEAQSLSFGGRIDAAGVDGFVVGRRRMSLTDAHRTRLRDALGVLHPSGEVDAGPLIDAWHGPDSSEGASPWRSGS